MKEEIIKIVNSMIEKDNAPYQKLPINEVVPIHEILDRTTNPD